MGSEACHRFTLSWGQQYSTSGIWDWERIFASLWSRGCPLLTLLCAFVQKHMSNGYEGMIIAQPLLSNASTEFIIPIVKSTPSSQKVPLALCSKYYIDFSDDVQYFSRCQYLLSRIYDEDSKEKTPLGKNPFFWWNTQRNCHQDINQEYILSFSWNGRNNKFSFWYQ